MIKHIHRPSYKLTYRRQKHTNSIISNQTSTGTHQQRHIADPQNQVRANISPSGTHQQHHITHPQTQLQANVSPSGTHPHKYITHPQTHPPRANIIIAVHSIMSYIHRPSYEVTSPSGTHPQHHITHPQISYELTYRRQKHIHRIISYIQRPSYEVTQCRP